MAHSRANVIARRAPNDKPYLPRQLIEPNGACAKQCRVTSRTLSDSGLPRQCLRAGPSLCRCRALMAGTSAMWLHGMHDRQADVEQG